MTNRNFTPVELEVLLKIYYSAEPYNGIPMAPAYQNAVGMWMHLNCIQVSVRNPEGIYSTTPRGTALVKALCAVQLPEETK